MPIYEYKCKKCNKEFEVFQKISAPDVKTCASCHGPVAKLISLSSFSLKGTGWYVTDYGGKKAPAGKQDDAPAPSATTETPAKKESKED
jgi:putative FmdB family regulatory protein